MFYWFLITLAFSANLPRKNSITTNLSNFDLILRANCSYKSHLLYLLIYTFKNKPPTPYKFSNPSSQRVSKWVTLMKFHSKMAYNFWLGIYNLVFNLSKNSILQFFEAKIEQYCCNFNAPLAIGALTKNGRKVVKSPAKNLSKVGRVESLVKTSTKML